MAEYYVSAQAAQHGSGDSPTNPMKFLWKAVSTLKDGDTLHIAEGRYSGQGNVGVLPKITVKDVSLIGGYSADFSARDPFKHLTIIGAPLNQEKSLSTNSVIHIEPTQNGSKKITIDGLCIDRGEACIYFSEGPPGPNHKIPGHFDCTCFGWGSINRKMSGSCPTIAVLSRYGEVTVRNCLLINNPWWGIYIKVGEGNHVVENNLILSYQGRGIEAIPGGGWGKPTITIKNNTIMFGHNIEGRALSIDPKKDNGTVEIVNNVLAWNDEGGITSKFQPAETLLMKDNLFYLNVSGDFNIAGKGIANAHDFDAHLMCKVEGNIHQIPNIISALAPAWLDRESASEYTNLIGNGFSTDDEIQACRKAVGLGDYELPGYDKKYPNYASLPKARPGSNMTRYPHPMKKGEVMDWSSVLVAIGKDAPRGICPVDAVGGVSSQSRTVDVATVQHLLSELGASGVVDVNALIAKLNSL